MFEYITLLDFIRTVSRFITFPLIFLTVKQWYLKLALSISLLISVDFSFFSLEHKNNTLHNATFHSYKTLTVYDILVYEPSVGNLTLFCEMSIIRGNIAGKFPSCFMQCKN